MSRLLQEVIKEKPCTLVLMVDNKSAIVLAKNPVLHDRSKHIDTKFRFIPASMEDRSSSSMSRLLDSSGASSPSHLGTFDSQS